MKFKQWLSKVNQEISAIAGIGLYDLADYMYTDCFENGYTPYETAIEVLEDNGFPMDLLEAEL